MFPRVAIVVSNPIQHFCPLYRRIADSGAVELKVYFASSVGLQPYFDRQFGRTVQWQPGLVEGFDHELLCLPDLAADSNKRRSTTHLVLQLGSYNPDVVVVYGYAKPESRAAIKWATRWHKKLVYISDAELRSTCALWKRMLKKIILPHTFSKMNAFLTVGDYNEAYYSRYGVDCSRFFRSPFPVDEDRIQDALQQRERLRREVRQRYNLPGDALVALAVGKMTPGKRHEDAVKAVCSLWHSGMHGKVFLLIAGDGATREVCESVAKEMCMEAVRFAGFVQVTELPAHYIASDVLLHPSSADRHPLAISEAVTCGLPCIVSNRVGSVGPTDDVRPGINGWEYSVGDVAALADRLRELAQHPDLLLTMSNQSLSIAQQRNMNRSLSGFLTAVHHVCTET